MDCKETLESSPKYLKPFILLDPHRRFNRIEPVKKNDGEEHPSLEVGNVCGKIHVAAGTRMNKRQSRKSLNYRWQVMEKNWSPDENNRVFINVEEKTPDENDPGAISVQIRKPVKAWLLLLWASMCNVHVYLCMCVCVYVCSMCDTCVLHQDKSNCWL